MCRYKALCSADISWRKDEKIRISLCIGSVVCGAF